MATTLESPNQNWYYGPAIDLIFGCGLIYVVAFPLLLTLPGPDSLAAITFLSMFIAGPHYGATLLRVADRPESRRRYGRFVLAVTVVLGGALIVGLHDVVVGSLLLTAYITWSPWHFSGQNYGLCLMFLRKRGVPISTGTKRLLYASFWLSFLPSLLIVHAGQDVDYVPLQKSAFETYQLMPLGLPLDWVRAVVPVLAVAYLATLVAIGVRLLRQASPAAIAPSAIIVVLQMLWWIAPGFLLLMGFNFYLTAACVPLVVSAVHSLQYLWITSYYAKREDPDTRLVPYIVKTTLAGAAALGVVVYLFNPNLFGTVPYDSGLGLLAASVLNLHHFLLDGAIWKLRDGAVARVLLGNATGPQPIGPNTRGIPLLRPAVWAIGAASLCSAILYVVDFEGMQAHSRERSMQAFERLDLIGRDSAWARQVHASQLASRGFHKQALEQIDRSLELMPTGEAYYVMGTIRERDRNWSAALEAYDQALELDPNHQKARARRQHVASRLRPTS